MARNTKQKRTKKKQQVMVVTMSLNKQSCCLDLVQVPDSLASDPEIASAFASSYKKIYLARNPQFQNAKFTYQIQTLR